MSGKGRDRVHVWGGVLGDRLRVGHFRQVRGRVEAAIDEVTSRTVQMNKPLCEHFDVCGGCLWQHVPYDHQLLMKQEIVKTCFAQARLDTGLIAPILGCDDPLFYRNKNDFTFGFGDEPALGYFESEIKMSGGRNRLERGRVPPVFSVKSCALQTDLADDILAKVRAAVVAANLPFYHPGSRRGLLRSLVIRQSAISGDVLLHFIAARPCAEVLAPIAKDLVLGESRIKGVVLSINKKRSKNAVPASQVVLAGDGWIVEQFLGVNIRVSPTSFLQVNSKQAEKLYSVALDYAALVDTDRVIDLFCGTGSLSLLLAQQAKEVVGIEVVEVTVRDAKENAAQNKIDNSAFLCGDVADVLPLHMAGNEKLDVITVNPPRAGVDKKVIEAMCAAQPKRMVYISCNAETLARDLVQLNRGGYRITAVQPVDMFPQTPHVEVVVKAEQKLRP